MSFGRCNPNPRLCESQPSWLVYVSPPVVRAILHILRHIIEEGSSGLLRLIEVDRSRRRPTRRRMDMSAEPSFPSCFIGAGFSNLAFDHIVPLTGTKQLACYPSILSAVGYLFTSAPARPTCESLTDFSNDIPSVLQVQVQRP